MPTTVINPESKSDFKHSRFTQEVHSYLEGLNDPLATSIQDLLERQIELNDLFDCLVNKEENDTFLDYWQNQYGQNIDGEKGSRSWMMRRVKSLNSHETNDILVHINSLPKGQLNQSLEYSIKNNPNFQQYRDPETSSVLLRDYIEALNNLYFDKNNGQFLRNIDSIKSADEALSSIYGSVLEGLIFQASNDSGREQWSNLNFILSSPVALKLGDRTTLQGMIYALASRLNSSLLDELLSDTDIVSLVGNIVTLKEVALFIEGAPHWGYGGTCDAIWERIYSHTKGSAERTGNPLVDIVTDEAMSSSREMLGKIQHGDTRYNYYSASANGSFRDQDNVDDESKRDIVDIIPVSSDGISAIIGPGGRVYAFQYQGITSPFIALGEFGEDMFVPNLHNEDEFKRFCEVYFLPQVRIALESRIGIKLNKLSMRSQLIFAQYFSEQTSLGNFARLSKALNKTNENERIKVLEAFLALEYGDHLGEAIIDLAEVDRKGEASQEIFSLINDIRANMLNWEKRAWFAQDDCVYKEYFIGIKRGIEMRVSQILSPAADILAGKSQDAVFYHRDGTESARLTINSIEQVIQGLKLIEHQTRNYAMAESALVDDHLPVSDRDSGLRSFSRINDSVGMTLRPHETDEAEARLRWSLALTPADQQAIFGKHLSVTKAGKPRNVKVSMRLDLEKISGHVALDLGTFSEDATNPENDPNTLLAALITVGVQHSRQRHGEGIMHKDYHVRETFSPICSDPHLFGEFIEMAAHHLTILRNKRVGKTSLKVINT